MNIPAIFNEYNSSYVQIPNCSASDFPEVETLSHTGPFSNEQEYENFAHEVPAQPEDLTAVLQTCNINASMNPHGYGLSMPAMFPASGYEPYTLLHTQPSIKSDNNAANEEVYVTTKQWRFADSVEEENDEFLRRRRDGDGVPVPTLSGATDRLRRSDMIYLFEQLRSLLPNPMAKSDKASILQNTIDYIESLRQQLAVRSKKHGFLQNKTWGNNISVNCEALIPMLAIDRPISSDCDKSAALLSLSSNYRDENLTLQYKGKDIFITITCVKKANILSAIILVLELNHIQVTDAFIVTTDTIAHHSLNVKAAEILDAKARETLCRTFLKLAKSELHITFQV